MLYVILLSCISWGSLIIFGPRAILKATIYFSDGAIVPGKIEIKPNLNISLADVKVYKINANLSDEDFISIRTVKIDWSINKFKPQVSLLIGSMEDNTFATVGNANLTIFTKSLSNMRRHLHFELKAENIKFLSGIAARKVGLTGRLRENLHKIENTDFIIEDISFPNLFFDGVGKVDGNLTKFDFKRPIQMQKNLVSVRYLDLKPKGRSAIDGKLLQRVKNNNGKIDFDWEINNFYMERPDIKLDNLTLSGAILVNDVNRLMVNVPWVLSLRDLKVLREVAVGRLSAEIVWRSKDNSQQSFTGFIEGLKLANDGFPLLELSQSFFAGSVEADMASQHFRTKIDLSAKTDPTFGFHVDSQNLLIMPTLRPGCSEVKCLQEKLKINYEMNIGDESLVGELFCERPLCTGGDLSLNAKTSNTVILFENLAKLKIFNPVLLALIFAEIMQSTPTASGHEIDFELSN